MPSPLPWLRLARHTESLEAWGRGSVEMRAKRRCPHRARRRLGFTRGRWKCSSRRRDGRTVDICEHGNEDAEERAPASAAHRNRRPPKLRSPRTPSSGMPHKPQLQSSQRPQSSPSLQVTPSPARHLVVPEIQRIMLCTSRSAQRSAHHAQCITFSRSRLGRADVQAVPMCIL